MLIPNSDVAAVFSQIADLLEIEGKNAFRVRAYRNAARTVSVLTGSVQAMVREQRDLTELEGIGADLAGKIAEIVETGTCALREQLRGELPPAIHELLTVPGVGPKRVMKLYQALGVQTLEQLYKAACDGRIREVPGFGAQVEERIRAALQARQSKKARALLPLADQLAVFLLAHLRAPDPAAQVLVAGSLRRRRETVGDLDILVSSAHPRAVIERFVNFEGVAQVLAHGSTRASVLLRQGIQVDLRVVAAVSAGAALHYFTGSKAHNIAVRTLALERGLKINEYGVFSGAERIGGETEASVFAAVGLPYIEPELREDRGELAAAREGRLPLLVDVADLAGDLHAHTRSGAGRNSLREMAAAAHRRGLGYLAVTDRWRGAAAEHGLDAAGVARQADAIDKLNAQMKPFTLLKGIEADILDDGSFDVPDAVLERLDLVIGAVNTSFGLSRERQTERILRAMDQRCFTMLAHPCGRLLLEREAYQADMQRIVRHARERGCFIELNAQPNRLDLSDSDCMLAKAEGVLVSVNSDAHSVLELDDLRFGIGQARRGWLEKGDVLNTRPLALLKALLAQARAGPAPAWAGKRGQPA